MPSIFQISETIRKEHIKTNKGGSMISDKGSLHRWDQNITTCILTAERYLNLQLLSDSSEVKYGSWIFHRIGISGFKSKI